MYELLQQRIPGTEVDESVVRRQLREQIAHLEGEVCSLFCSTYPRKGFEWNVRSRRGPRVLSIRELEELRDDLAHRLQPNRKALGARSTARGGAAAGRRGR